MSWRRLLFLLLLGLGAVVSPPAGATQDPLVRSDPAAGEDLQAPPTAVRLEFADGVEHQEVVVVDSRGTDWVQAAPEVDGNKVAVAQDSQMPAGQYEVQWQAVTAGGDLVSGVVPFTIAPSPLPMPTLAQPDRQALELVHSSGPGAPPWLRTALIAVVGAVVSLVVVPRVTRWRVRRMAEADPVEQALRASGAIELGATSEANRDGDRSVPGRKPSC